jgi:hypothetical protein
MPRTPPHPHPPMHQQQQQVRFSDFHPKIDDLFHY